MQHRTDYIGIPFGEKLRQLLLENRRLLAQMAAAAAGAVMAGGRIVGGIAPFGVAFAAAVPEGLFAPALFGALFGYLWLQPAGGMEYVAAVLLLGALRWTLGSGSLWRRVPYAAPAAAGGAMLFGGAAVALAVDRTAYAAALAVAVALLAAGAAWFYTRTLTILRSRVSGALREERGCLYVSFLLTTAALGRFTIAGVSVGRVLAGTGTLLFAVAGGPSAGAVLGVGAGLSAMAMGRDSAFLMGSYAAGGLLAGVFARFGRVPAALAFLVTAALCGVASPTARGLQIALAECLIAAALVLPLPQRAIAYAAPDREEEAADLSAERSALGGRMERFAAALREIGATTREVSRKLAGMHAVSIEDVWQRTMDTVCKKCPRRYRCWQTEFDRTMDAVNTCMLTLRETGVLEPRQIPQPLRENCRAPEELAAGLTAGYNRYLAEVGSRRRVSQIRGVVTDQFDGLARLVEDLAAEWASPRRRDRQLEEKARSVLAAAGLDPGPVCCTLSPEDRLTLECPVNPLKLPRLDAPSLALTLGEAVGRELELPEVSGAVLTFEERAVYTVRWGSSQLTQPGSRITGDTFRCFFAGRGRFVMVLSDGMGTGGSAAVDSAMTADLLRRLIEAGVGCDAALKIVNSALLLKSGEETLATADVAEIDLYTGRARFYKAGAAPTYLVKNRRAGYIQSDSLPAGILEGVAFESSTLTLRDGDWLALVSDGVTATGADWVKSQLEAGLDGEPAQLAQSLAAAARERQLPGREDDVTVLAARLDRA